MTPDARVVELDEMYSRTTPATPSATLLERAGQAVSRVVGPVLAPFLVSRAVVLVAALVLEALTLGGVLPRYGFVGTAPLGVLSSTYDAQWHEGIAAGGYSTSGDTGVSQNYAFFPLYAFFMRMAGDLTGLGRLDGGYAVVGVLLSHAFFLLALALLYRLTLVVWGDAGLASRSVWALAALPWAFVFSMTYTESLFLFLLLAIIWVAWGERHHPRPAYVLLAGLLGALAALTRQQGVLVALAALWLVAVVPRHLPVARRLTHAAMAVGPALLMLVGFVAYIGVRTGNPWAALHAKEAWGGGWVGDLLHLPLSDALALNSVDSYRFVGSSLGLLAWIALTALMLAFFAWAYRRAYGAAQGTWPGAWVFPAFALAYFAGTASGIPLHNSWGRYMIVVFPLAWGVGWALRTKRATRLFVSLALLGQIVLFASVILLKVIP
jgi:hypothetical protein